jgi:hypothetical protein
MDASIRTIRRENELKKLERSQISEDDRRRRGEIRS